MVKQAIRPAIFTWRQTEPELILCAVRWSLRDSLSFRDGEERLRERGLEADHTTIWRWVQHDGPDLEERLRRHLKPTKRSWRVDETDVCVRGRWWPTCRRLNRAYICVRNQSLSVDLHSRSDSECLERAAATRKVLQAMVEMMARVQEEHNTLKDAVAKLKKP